MAGSLTPCGACNRHVRSSERSCPFCGTTLALSEPIKELRLLTRLDRGRVVALGALLSAAGIALGCHERHVVHADGAPPRPLDTSSAAPSAQPSPGAPSAPAPTSKQPSAPTGAPVAVYGAAPPMPEPGSEPKPR